MDQENLNEISTEEEAFGTASPPLLKKIIGHKIMDLKNNHIPRGLVPVERLYERNDTSVNPEKQIDQATVSDWNIGMEDEPRFVKLSNSLSVTKRSKYLKLMKEFKDIFA